MPLSAPSDDAVEVAGPPSGSRWARLSRSGALLVGIGVGAAAVGICWASLSLLGGDEAPANAGGSRSSSAMSRAGRAPAPFETDGTLTLAEVGAGLETGEPCSGTGGYSDIDFGTQVNVTDADGTLVATGSLGLGEKAEAGCVFPFTVDDIAPGSKFYTVEVAHRGGLTQTEAALRAGSNSRSATDRRSGETLIDMRGSRAPHRRQICALPAPSSWKFQLIDTARQTPTPPAAADVHPFEPAPDPGRPS